LITKLMGSMNTSVLLYISQDLVSAVGVGLPDDLHWLSQSHVHCGTVPRD
jgi:hypothetical protein